MKRELCATREQKNKPGMCGRHPKRVYFDGRYCPACVMLREIPPRTRKKVFKRGRKVEALVDKFKYFM